MASDKSAIAHADDQHEIRRQPQFCHREPAAMQRTGAHGNDGPSCDGDDRCGLNPSDDRKRQYDSDGAER